MKPISIQKFSIALCVAATLAGSVFSHADEVTTTTTRAGTISEFGPDAIVIHTETSTEPLRYTYTKSTTYVDDEGNPVSVEVVKSGLPVTVHYTKDGERLVADRVIVHKKVQTRAPGETVEKHTTTTTTTESK